MTSAEQQLATSQYYDSEAIASCVCCGLRYPGTGSHCHRCQAPLELSRIISARQSEPRFVSVLGDSGSGKTVYLGMLLDMLSKGVCNMRGTAHGSFSVAVQDNTVSALGQRSFPEKTSSEAGGWQWVQCEVRNDRRPKQALDLVTPDLAGEAIALELDQAGAYPAIQSVVSQSMGVILLCDAISARAAPLQEDIFALKLVAYVHSVQKKQAAVWNNKKLDTPVAIVFTKCDQCPEVEDDPERFAMNNLPRLMQFCQQDFAKFQFFAARVVANCATGVDEWGRCSDLALHVEPHGIVEPLDWIMKQGV